MIAVGTITSVWRYPVKSMAGEVVTSSAVDMRGLVDDRKLALHTPDGKIASGKNTRRFIHVTGLSTYRAHTRADGETVITTPDGAALTASHPETDRELSDRLGRPVSIRSETTIAHHDDGEIHLITSEEIERLRQFCRASDLDPRRFRPNLVAEHSHEQMALTAGTTLRTDRGLRLLVTKRTERCPMITHAQAGLPTDRSPLAELARNHGNEFGIYLKPLVAGRVSPGDRLFVD